MKVWVLYLTELWHISQKWNYVWIFCFKNQLTYPILGHWGQGIISGGQMQNGIVTLGPSSSRNNFGILLSSVFFKVLIKDLFSRGNLLVKAAYQNCIAFYMHTALTLKTPHYVFIPNACFPNIIYRLSSVKTLYHFK